MFTITAPVAGYSGVKAGVRFVGGVGETDSVRAVNYFRRHGYSIEAAEAAEQEKPKRRNSRKPAAPAAGEGADASSTKEDDK